MGSKDTLKPFETASIVVGTLRLAGPSTSTIGLVSDSTTKSKILPTLTLSTSSDDRIRAAAFTFE